MGNNFDHIEKFFDGTMDASEVKEFEKRMASDSEFAEEIRLYSQARALIQAAASKRMKQRLDSLRHDESTTVVETFMKYRLTKSNWYAMAASVALLIAAVFVYDLNYSQKSGTTLTTLYESYYEVPGTALLASRNTNSSEAEVRWNKAINEYNEKQYQQAAVNFSSLLSDTSFSRHSAASFYLGNCFLNLNKPDSAIHYFSLVSENSSFAADAKWYLGLSYLASDDVKNASDQLTAIKKSDDHPKKSQARKLLRQLSSFK